MKQILVLGCGPAARGAAGVVRQEDPDTLVTLVTQEMTPFYLRPVLADFVAGHLGREVVVPPAPELLTDPGLEVQAGRRVYRVFPHESRVLLSDGTSLYFDRLLLAMGSTPRLEDYAVRLRNKVHTLSTLADAVRLAGTGAVEGDWTLVSGEGHTGLETVRALVGRGCRVVYLTSHTRFWSARSSVARSDVLRLLMDAKVEVLFDETILDILDANGEGYRVVTSSRRTIDVKVVCEARDLEPAVGCLEGSGVLVDGGVVVDPELRTNFDNIFAAGDVAVVFDPEGSRRRTNFGWASAGEQGAVAGYNLVHGGGRAVDVASDAHFRRVEGPVVTGRWRR